MRRRNDAYFTPEGATRALMDRVPELLNKRGLRIFEACHGEGHITNVLRGESHGVITGDIDPAMKPSIVGNACTTWPAIDVYGHVLGGAQVDWTITNPPFSYGAAILAHHLRQLERGKIERGIAMLLRISFLEPCVEKASKVNRGALPAPHQIIVLPRISFTGDGKTDAATVAWMIWFASEIFQVGPSIQTVTKAEMQEFSSCGVP